MSKIVESIPARNFEIVRDRIGEILADEFEYQVINFYDPEIDVEVLSESINPIDNTGIPTINISTASGKYSDKNHGGSVKGAYLYFIDVYAHAKTSEENPGDQRANVILQKIIGKCQYILDNPVYKTLGFSTPFINRVYCGDFNVATVTGKNDALNTVMARLTFTVEATETTQLIIPSLITGYETQVKLVLTDKGYKYSKTELI